jgi:hypothetical protein
MHPDDAALMALTDRELPPGLSAEHDAHLATCADCRNRLADIQALTDETAGALQLLDVAPPSISFSTLVARSRPHRSASRVRRWAAAAVFALALSGLALAAPRSALRDWLRSVLDASSRPPAERLRTAHIPAPEQFRDTVADHSGVTVNPGASLRIDFARWQASGEIAIRLSESPQVSVRTAAGAAAFSTSTGLLGIDNASSTANYEMSVPRHASRIEIRVAGSRVFLREISTGVLNTGENGDDVRRISLVSKATASQMRR